MRWAKDGMRARRLATSGRDVAGLRTHAQHPLRFLIEERSWPRPLYAMLFLWTFNRLTAFASLYCAFFESEMDRGALGVDGSTTVSLPGETPPRIGGEAAFRSRKRDRNSLFTAGDPPNGGGSALQFSLDRTQRAQKDHGGTPPPHPGTSFARRSIRTRHVHESVTEGSPTDPRIEGFPSASARQRLIGSAT